jgi:hypothetical protein
VVVLVVLRAERLKQEVIHNEPEWRLEVVRNEGHLDIVSPAESVKTGGESRVDAHRSLTCSQRRGRTRLNESIVMMSKQIRQLVAAGVLAGVLALYGCGSKENAATSPTPTSSPAKAATQKISASLPSGLRGSWRRTMKARDWRPAGGGFPAGTFRFDVDKNGEVSVYFPRTDTVDFSTQFVVTGRHLTIESVPICPGQTARYKWRASPNELRLTAVGHDACRPRAVLFGGTWTRRR